MGYRPNIIEKLSYSGEIVGYNHNPGEFDEDLHRLGLEFFEPEDAQGRVEITVESIQAIKDEELEDEQLQYLAFMLKEACKTPYAELTGYVGINWF